MVVPPPPFDLKDHCSVISDDTLYVYAAAGFASIPLKRNGTWTTLSPGESVSGAACVTGGVDGDNSQTALYVVGGRGSSPGYTGLQRYIFSAAKWDTIPAGNGEVKDFLDHGAAYINSTASILVYAGAPNGTSVASTTTWLVSTRPPYGVLAGTAEVAGTSTVVPPAISPVLLPWNDDEVALLAGFTTTPEIYLFNGTIPGWRDSGVSLPNALPPDSHCALVSGSDGSKVLETFHVDVSPGTVDSLVVLNPGAVPVHPAQPVSASPSRTSRRDYSALTSFPAYNGTFAPSTTWPSYSLAQGGDIVVISGGSGNESLALFNQSSNSWVNATELFYGDGPIPQQPLPSTSPPSASASPTGVGGGPIAPAAGGAPHKNIGTIIEATLGSLLGLLAISIVLLLLLRHKKTQHGSLRRRRPGSSYDDRLSFQDRGIEPLAQHAFPMATGPAPRITTKIDSVAIMSGMVGDEKEPRLGPGQTSPPTVSTGKAHGGSSQVYVTEAVGAPGDRRTDEGWGRYFQDDNATTTNLATLQPSTRDTVLSEATRSDYRSSAYSKRGLTGLNFGFLEQPRPLGRVATGSPTTTSVYSDRDRDGRSLVIPEGQSARISSVSGGTISDDDDEEADGGGGRRDEFSSGVPASINENSQWLGTRDQSWLGRPPSSVYSQGQGNYSRDDRDHRRVSDMDASASADGPRAGGRRSSVVIPEELDGPPAGTRSNGHFDLSWLNINAER